MPLPKPNEVLLSGLRADVECSDILAYVRHLGFQDASVGSSSAGLVAGTIILQFFDGECAHSFANLFAMLSPSKFPHVHLPSTRYTYIYKYSISIYCITFSQNILYYTLHFILLYFTVLHYAVSCDVLYQ